MRFTAYCAALLLSVSLCGCHHHTNPAPTPAPLAEVQDTTPAYIPPGTPPASEGTPAPAPASTSAEDEAIIQAVLANGDELERSTSGERAVCFGDNYEGTPAELHECVGDARKNVLNLVRVEGFNPKNILLLTNAQCTKANYEKWATWALADRKPGDRRFVGTSSHGAEDTDADGKLINVLVTFDMISRNEWSSATEVSPEFWSKLLRSEGGSYVFLNDSCHAGGQMRQALGIAALKNKRLVRSIDGPPAVQARINKATERGTSWRSVAITGSVVWACQPSELSEEDEIHGGLGTDAYWVARKKLIASNPKIGTIIQEANRILHSEYMAGQHMGLTGSNTTLFQK